jgi:hypothetical protein
METILQKPTEGIPSKFLNIMEHSFIERIAGVQEGEYKRNPEKVYVACQQNLGTCILDQFIPENPLTIGSHGYEEGGFSATTGIKEIVVDGITIDSPEAVVKHMEEVYFAQVQDQIRDFNEQACIKEIIAEEKRIQEVLGPGILKTGYGFIGFPVLHYDKYGYESYLMAYALYPEVIEKCFKLEADLQTLKNSAAVRAYEQGNFPPLFRLDHDMADSKSTLVDIKSLDRIWFPHFARCLESVLKTEVRLIWHCDGNLMDMVPRLLDVGIRGFQGFQYEDGMDYKEICGMKSKDGNDLLIQAGVSVTRTLPMGKPGDVKKELKWLVENGPRTGLFLACSSSVAPGVTWENLKMLIEGLKYYQHRRDF